ncbi:MAG: acyl-CoA thioesterase [Alphaproteobacteria bacterium]|nr:acyl-CoA thioesterase [Alphaproteobacteria bacterium]MBT7942248.1 acyl-CoA thioesterase [Alphaproteobacteria bacterium]
MSVTDDDTGPDLTDAATFQHWTPVSLRFSDQDSLGHVNNVAYAAYVEQGRVALIDKLLRTRGDGIDYILASVQIDYRREMHFPGTVDIGGRLLRIGNKSISTGYGLFKDGINVATASSVNVFFDPATRKTLAIPEALRRVLEEDLA